MKQAGPFYLESRRVRFAAGVAGGSSGVASGDSFRHTPGVMAGLAGGVTPCVAGGVTPGVAGRVTGGVTTGVAGGVMTGVVLVAGGLPGVETGSAGGFLDEAGRNEVFPTAPDDSSASTLM